MKRFQAIDHIKTQDDLDAYVAEHVEELRNQLGKAKDAVKHYERYEDEEHLVDALYAILQIPNEPASGASSSGGSSHDSALPDEHRDYDHNMNPVDDAEFGMKP